MMTEKPLISIIIPTYNRAHLIGETIQSIVDQTYQNWELFIIDDGSEDKTDDVVSEFNDERIKYAKLEHSGSLSKLRNHGIRKAKGHCIAFQDSDDIWLKDKLSFQMDLLSKHPEACFVFGNGKFFGTTEFVEPECEELFVGNAFLPFLIESRFPFLAPTLLFRSSLLDEIGFMDETLKCASEIDFFLQMSKIKPGIFSNQKLVMIRKHVQNTSSSTEYGFLSFSDAIQIANRLYEQKALSMNQFNSLVSKYYYGMGLLAIRTKRNSLAFQSFRSHVKVAPLHWKGWVRLLQTSVFALLSGKKEAQPTSIIN